GGRAGGRALPARHRRGAPFLGADVGGRSRPPRRALERGSEPMSARVRVALDATAIPARPVGAGRYVLELATALTGRDDVDVSIIARRRDGARWRAVGATGVVERAPSIRPLRLVWEQV